jgi:hypothetical protein
MTKPVEERRKLHFDLAKVGLRAQATAVGLVQLCLELRRTSVLDDPAVERIKDAIADEVSVTAPRRMVASSEYRADIRARLDRLFSGQLEVGSAEALAMGDTHDWRAYEEADKTPDQLPSKAGKATIVQVEFTDAELHDLMAWIDSLPEPRPDFEQAVRMIVQKYFEDRRVP